MSNKRLLVLLYYAPGLKARVSLSLTHTGTYPEHSARNPQINNLRSERLSAGLISADRSLKSFFFLLIIPSLSVSLHFYYTVMDHLFSSSDSSPLFSLFSLGAITRRYITAVVLWACVGFGIENGVIVMGEVVSDEDAYNWPPGNSVCGFFINDTPTKNCTFFSGLALHWCLEQR